MAIANQGLTPPLRQDHARGFFGIFLVGFTALLAVALVAQLLFLPWRAWLPGAEGEKSLIGGVRSATYTFMSHLI